MRKSGIRALVAVTLGTASLVAIPAATAHAVNPPSTWCKKTVGENGPLLHVPPKNAFRQWTSVRLGRGRVVEMQVGVHAYRMVAVYVPYVGFGYMEPNSFYPGMGSCSRLHPTSRY
ncbi:hypothetical protein [Embleya hyalina]|uniref:Uncharacterized protein n=1 Tax=Embleya hyalina TaxID=516124 RepID=A0A401YR26_9ACTN|nr:hypothetical protein [Embleya hyalina]GCD97060.1 hypothetical protein EHYA_04747 [Embleya hyalina]